MSNAIADLLRNKYAQPVIQCVIHSLQYTQSVIYTSVIQYVVHSLQPHNRVAHRSALFHFWIGQFKRNLSPMLYGS